MTEWFAKHAHAPLQFFSNRKSTVCRSTDQPDDGRSVSASICSVSPPTPACTGDLQHLMIGFDL
jgi:hypothetical protein